MSRPGPPVAADAQLPVPHPCDAKATLIGLPAPSLPRTPVVQPKVVLDLVTLGHAAADIQHRMAPSRRAAPMPPAGAPAPLRGATLGKDTLVVARTWIVRPLARPTTAAPRRPQLGLALMAAAIVLVVTAVALAW